MGCGMLMGRKTMKMGLKSGDMPSCE